MSYPCRSYHLFVSTYSHRSFTYSVFSVQSSLRTPQAVNPFPLWSTDEGIPRQHPHAMSCICHKLRISRRHISLKPYPASHLCGICTVSGSPFNEVLHFPNILYGFVFLGLQLPDADVTVRLRCSIWVIEGVNVTYRPHIFWYQYTNIVSERV